MCWDLLTCQVAIGSCNVNWRVATFFWHEIFDIHMEPTFDRSCSLVGWLESDKIFDRHMSYNGFIKNLYIFGRTNTYLGIMKDGFLRDRSGYVVAFVRGATNGSAIPVPATPSTPATPPIPATPSTPATPASPAKPMASWSSKSWEEFVSQ